MTAAGNKTSTGIFAEAASFGEVVILGTLWSGTENPIRLAGPERFAGKPVIDTTWVQKWFVDQAFKLLQN